MKLTAEQAIEDELIITWLYTDEIVKDWKKALHAIIEYNVQIAIDPLVSDYPLKIIRDFMSQHTSDNVDRMSIQDLHDYLDSVIYTQPLWRNW